MRILGVDPGTKGALAILDTVKWTVAIIDMPLEIGTKGKEKVSAQGVLEVVRAAAPDAAFLEEVHASPQMGVTSAFSFGDGYGCTRTAILAYGCALWPIRPQVWKPAMKAPKDKKQATTRASQLVPAAHSILFGPRGGAYDGRAEALLLSLYGCFHLKDVPKKALTLVPFPTL
ncbi:hypothetical protein CcrC1_gp484 [Caulobacter phage C1]|nr:hypothetical protein CcrC1_gp484 [Caulobacter phage C1]UTU08697.1 hypothetical protein CcrC2_gp470 [Caulobacter phage C2]UTU09229.1 hypothetical protein CcrJ4_gp482 [Caulobacter phage J4]UTU09791.1 hypothetical protein CcrBL47_gp509 [Caulobacter phage BL47]UTU10349.1 hypothetical protein CcrRB23_gp487 [Caulobacter phage RB23]WGN97359.1 hypothetical protein [Bertelyvirus sp.]